MTPRCHCAEDGGTFCWIYALATADEEGNELAATAVQIVRRSTLAQALPFHVTDPMMLARIAGMIGLR